LGERVRPARVWHEPRPGVRGKGARPGVIEKKWFLMEKGKVKEKREAPFWGGRGISLFERRYVVSV